MNCQFEKIHELHTWCATIHAIRIDITYLYAPIYGSFQCFNNLYNSMCCIILLMNRTFIRARLFIRSQVESINPYSILINLPINHHYWCNDDWQKVRKYFFQRTQNNVGILLKWKYESNSTSVNLPHSPR